MADNEIELLLQNEDFKSIVQNKKNQVDIADFFEEVKKSIKSNILTQFALSQHFDNFQKGGPVTTLHNTENQVFANSEDERRFNQSFDRKNYEGRREVKINPKTGKSEVLTDNRLSKQRKDKFKSRTPLIDEYTGEKLQRDGSTHLDHVTSAKAIHENKAARLYMTDEKRNDMAVSSENLAYTDSSLNQSKGEHDIEDWGNRTQKGQQENNNDRFSVDKKKVGKKAGIARNFINSNIKKDERNYYVKNTTKAAGQRAIGNGKKQVIGVVLFELTDLFFSVTTPILKSWNTFNSMSDRIEEFKVQFQIEFKNIKGRLQLMMKKVFSSGATGFISGFLSTIVEVLVNMFITTAASFGKILCDGIQGIMQAFKVLLSKDPGVTKQEKVKKAIEIIGTVIIASVGVLLSKAVSTQLLGTPLAFFSDEIGILLGALVTGFFTAALLFSVENFGIICAQVKASFSDIHYGLTVSKKEIESTYQMIIIKVDDAYTKILTRIEEHYSSISDLQAMVRDFSQIADIQLQRSVTYAAVLGVEEENILKDVTDIDDFFMN